MIIGTALYNISTFWNLPGGLWVGLRIFWFLGLLAWLGLNLFYWPFWLAAGDRTMRNTYTNCLRFWILHPGTAIVLYLVCLLIGLLSLPFASPIILGAVFLIALIAETAVHRSLQAADRPKDCETVTRGKINMDNAA